MIKYITLIALLLPYPALSHDWDQHQWLNRILTNHVNINECWKTINNGDTVAFRDECSPFIMGQIENKAMEQYHLARDVHPNITDIEFFELHFNDGVYTNADIVAIGQSVLFGDRVSAVIAAMAIAEGLTRIDK